MSRTRLRKTNIGWTLPALLFIGLVGIIGPVYAQTPLGFGVLHTFSTALNGDNSDGAVPNGSLTPGGDGFFYGATQIGGSAGNGTIFKIRPDGSGFQLLYTFTTGRQWQ